MTSELSEFLADLGGRRERLLQLVRPDEAGALIAELTELGEQLVIAEEELRVQQEELVAAGTCMQALVHEREELRHSAAQPYVLTDRRGVVLETNLAADRLIRRPAIRATPRPIATWFEVADRPAVRTIISRLSAGQEVRAELRALLKRSDHSTLPVRVLVTTTPGGDPSQLELFWRLEAEPIPSALPEAQPRPDEPGDQVATLQLVTTEPGSASPEPTTPPQPTGLATELTMLAVELAGCHAEEHLLSVAAERARRLIPHAQHAGVLLLHSKGRAEEAASSGEPVSACLGQEIGLREGPALAALTQRAPVLVADTRSEPRWAAFGRAAAEVRIHSILAVPVMAGEKVLGALSLYAGPPDAFDEQAAAAASLVAIQLGLSLDHVRTVQNLRAGLATRAEIGEAMGILMERRRITSEDAFQVLALASQKNNVKLHAIAQIVAETGQDPATIRSR